jgi:hypothetical protein
MSEKSGALNFAGESWASGAATACATTLMKGKLGGEF